MDDYGWIPAMLRGRQPSPASCAEAMEATTRSPPVRPRTRSGSLSIAWPRPRKRFKCRRVRRMIVTEGRPRTT